MKINILLIALLFLISNFTFGQTNKTESNFVNYQKGVGIETFYQGNYAVGLGGIVGYGIGNKKKANFAMGIYTDIFFVTEPIIGPRVKVSLNNKGVFGVSGISLNFSNYYRNGINDFRVTADLNISSHGIATFFVGYSMRFSQKHFSEIGQFRLGLNLSLVNKME
jgi:hypothetical protein